MERTHPMKSSSLKPWLAVALLLAACGDDPVDNNKSVTDTASKSSANADTQASADAASDAKPSVDTQADATAHLDGATLADSAVVLDAVTPNDSASGADVTSDTGAAPREDTAASTPPDAMVPADAASALDASAQPPTLEALVEGVWLIGWAGGMNHFSWVRFALPTSGAMGTAWVRDGKALVSNTPFWPCNGKTSWNLANQPDKVQLHLPSPKCTGKKSTLVDFANPIPAGAAAFPKGAIYRVAQFPQSAGPAVSAFKFADDQCNATMTACKDPLK